LAVLLSLNKNISHPGDVFLHKIFVERIGESQPADEGSGGYALVAVVYQGDLTMKIVNIVLQALPAFNLTVRMWLLFLWNSLREAN